MKKIGKISIVVCALVLCACVFPFCLIRKDANVDSRLDVIYEFTDLSEQMTQTFVAQTGYISDLAFDITFPEGRSEEGALVIHIKDVNNGDKLVAEKIVPIQEVTEDAFSYTGIHAWLRKGAMYSYSVFPQEGTDVRFCVGYTSHEDAASGSQYLKVDDQLVNGQAVTRYVYAYPLNMKNIVCIWAFIWLLALIIMELISGKGTCSQNKLLIKLESTLQKYQIPVLVLELTVILLMLVRISRNEAVHWDEAYTWKMVTDNNFVEMLNITVADVHPPLYYAVVMLAMKIFGQNIFVAKLVSVAGTAATGD